MKAVKPPYLRVVFCLLLITSSIMVFVASPSAAQSGTPGDPYKAELLDWKISVSGPNYVLENVALEEYPHGRGERIYVTSVESLGFVEIAFFDDQDTAEDSIDIMLRDFASASTSFAVIDSGVDGDIHLALARFQIDKRLNGYFYVEIAEDIDGNTDVMQSMYSLDSDFMEQLAIAREEIDLNGMAFFADPVVDIDVLIQADEALLVSTPEPVKTLRQGTFEYDSGPATLQVSGVIGYDFAFVNDTLDVKFLESTNGYAVVGYIHQAADSADQVMASVFEGAPADSSAPVELHIESDENAAFGVYRITTTDESRIMVIQVQRLDDDLWMVQAMAVSESTFLSEFHAYQDGVSFDGNPLLEGVSIDEILAILDQGE